MKRFAISLILASVSTYSYANNNFKASLSFGTLNTEAKELVYDQNKMLSKLDWQTNHMPIIKADLNLNVTDDLSIGFNAYQSLTENKGLMHDYDWINNNNSLWSHLSIHENTQAKTANKFDLNMQVLFFDDNLFKIKGILGYQRSYFSWLAKDGILIYPEGSISDENGTMLVNSIKEIKGGKPGISYEQTFDIPYAGISGQFNFKDLEVNLLALYSRFGKASDKDIHYLKNTTYYVNSSNNVEYLGLYINAGYNMFDHLKLFTGLTYDSYKEVRGDTKIIDSTGSVTENKKSGGIANTSYTLFAGIEYKFSF